MDLLYFVLLISILIFVHELGHFAFAKIFGVKVLTFSIGFGPKPIENVMTFTPKIFANAKCPDSWTKMRTLMRMTK